MKKVLSLLSLILLMVVMVSCGDKEKPGAPKELPTTSLSSEVTILTPGGMPYLALGGLLPNENIKVSVVSGPDDLPANLVKGEYDIIVAPINAAANLFNKGNSEYQVSHVLTGNNAYVVSKTKLDSISDLAGQEVLAFGKSGSIGIPGSMLKKVYELNELDVANIKYEYSNSNEVYQTFSKVDKGSYALMSEPEISKLVLNDEMDIKTIDLATVVGSEFAQACIYVNPNSENKEDINKVLTLIGQMVEFLNTHTEVYVDFVLPLDRKFEAMGKAVILRSVPLARTIFKEAKTNKNYIENTLNLLGVALPSDAFYR